MPSSVINSDDGVISGTSGLKSTGGDDGVLVFQSKGTETARINTDKQIVAAAGTASLPIYSTTGDVNTGIYFPAADNIGFATNGVIRGRWTTDGLCFNTDTAAANALDDYEEGTWTPSVGGNATYNAQVGTYTKIGNIVTVAFDIYVNTIGTGSATTISGLPFTTANTTPYNENGCGVAYFASIATSVTYLTAVLNKNATTLHFDGLTAAGATMSTTINVFQNNTDLYCTITYLVA